MCDVTTGQPAKLNAFLVHLEMATKTHAHTLGGVPCRHYVAFENYITPRLRHTINANRALANFASRIRFMYNIFRYF